MARSSPQRTMNTVQSEIDAFKKVREGGKADEIKNAMEGFTQKVYAIFGKLYQQQGGEGQVPPESMAPLPAAPTLTAL